MNRVRTLAHANQSRLLLASLLVATLLLTLFGPRVPHALSWGCTDNQPSQPQPFKPYYVYTTNSPSNDVSMLRADKDGKLTFFGKAPVGKSPTDIALAYDNAFVANGADNTISILKMDAHGALQPVSTVPTCTAPLYLTYHEGAPNHPSHLYVSCSGSDEVVVYETGIDAAYKPTLTEKQRLAVAKPGKVSESFNVYVPSVADGNLYQFDRGDPLVPGTPASLPAGSSPIKTWAADLGDILFVIDFQDGTLKTFDITLGDTKPLFAAKDTFAVGTSPVAITGNSTSSPNGLYVVAQGSNVVAQYHLETLTYKPTKVGASDVGANAVGIAATTRSFPILVYVANADGHVRSYKVQEPAGGMPSDGSLTPLDTFNAEASGVTAIAVSDPMYDPGQTGSSPADMATSSSGGCPIVISGFSPTSAPAGANITISGQKLGGTSAVVTFAGGVIGSVASGDDSSIVVTVPQFGVQKGPITVDNPPVASCQAVSPGEFTPQ